MQENHVKIVNPLPYYEKIGSGRRSMIFIHGFGTSRKSWYDILPLLDCDYSIYLVDLIGCGDSPAPSNWAYTLMSQAEALYSLIKKESLSHLVLVGQSYGGGIVILLYFLLNKIGYHDLIEKLILIDPAIYPQKYPFFVKIPRIPLINHLVLSMIPPEIQVRSTLTSVFHNKDIITKERINRFTSNIASSERRHALIETAKNIVPENIEEIIKQIPLIVKPVKIIYGDSDPVIPHSNFRKLLAKLPNSEVYIMKECGHVPQEEKPEDTAKIILDFIAK